MIHTKTDSQIKMDAERIYSYNPNTGDLLGAVPIYQEQDVQTAVSRARAAQPAWAKRPLAERIQILRQVQVALVEHREEIVFLVAQEVGKTQTDALIGDILITLGSLDGTLKLAPSFLRREAIPQDLLHKTKRTYLVREPKGVIGLISPYNFPVLLSLQTTFAALVAGNSVVHKPSEHASLTALRIQALFHEAGLPRDLFQVVTGGPETGKRLIRAGVDHISLVGSTQSGRAVATAAGERLIPTNLELSGNNVMIVLEDAQLSRAVDATLAYAFTNNGQVCAAASHLYVHQAIAGRFNQALAERVQCWRTSKETQPGGGDVTALINETALQEIDALVQEAVADGARVLCGGQRLPGSTAPIYQPTILLDTTPEMRIRREESFGPILTVSIIAHEDEAIALTNNAAYGLTASVWTGDHDRAWQIARGLQVASVAINDHLWPFFSSTVPWGGIKDSGWGRLGGREGLRTMTYPKVISYERLNLPREPYWYPRPKWLHFALLMLIPLLYARAFRARLGALLKLIAGLPRAARGASYR